MRVGEVFSARVRGLTSEGQGVVEHPSGCVVFVPGVWLDEQVRLRVIQVKNRYAQGQLLELETASEDRRPAPCPHQGFGPQQCGGCPWQMVTYSAQLAAKQARVAQSLARLAPRAQLLPIAASPQELGYRNRAQVKTDGTRLGYLAASSHQLAPINDCALLNPACQAQLQQLRQQLPNPAWRPKGKGTWTSIDINETAQSVNQRLPFAQANSEQNRFMQAWLAEQLAPFDRQWPLLELFSGSGNFTRVISAAGFRQVTAADIAGDAIAALANAQLPGVTALSLVLWADGALTRLLKRSAAKLLVLDPPRDGLKQAEQLTAKSSQLEAIAYISCDLATFVRDCGLLIKQGFSLESVQPVDQFPQTPHLELLGWLRRG